MDVTKLHKVKDALYMLYDTWDEASPESICKAYNKLKMHSAESMVKMLQHVQEAGNKDSLNAHDLEDWVNLENQKALVSTLCKTTYNVLRISYKSLYTLCIPCIPLYTLFILFLFDLY